MKTNSAKANYQRVCASFIEFKNTVDMMGCEDFCQFLRDDEE
ncbi:hypothetical protein ACX941_004668 [Escherichia coli]